MNDVYVTNTWANPTPETGKAIPLPWTLDERGWCNEADEYENQPLIVRAVNHADKLAEALAGFLADGDHPEARQKGEAALAAYEADQ